MEGEHKDTDITIPPDGGESSTAPSKRRIKRPDGTERHERQAMVGTRDTDEIGVEEACMPQSWADCKPIFSVWLLVTLLIFGLCLVTIPVGCILAILASFLYFSKKGTLEEYGGRYTSQLIYWTAFAAWSYDMVVFTLTMLAWVALVYGECKDYDYNICQFRKSTGYFVAAQMSMIAVHAIVSFMAYIRMRDCCIDIILDEREARERFADMEKQIFDEFRRKRKEELESKKKKKKKKKTRKPSTHES